MRNILFVSALLAVSIASCAPSTTSLPAATLVSTPKYVYTFTPTPNISQNITLITPEILDEIPDNLSLHGTLLLNGYENNPSYFFDLKNKSTKIIPNSFYGAQVSPDGKILAYFEYSENSNETWDTLVITNDFANKKIISWNENWHLKGVDLNGNLFIQNKREDPLPSFVVMNPNNNEITEIKPDFPDIETIYYAAEWWFPVYSPDGTKVIYTSISQTSRIVLWDITKQRVITTLSSINNPYGLEPVWSSNGKNYVMALENMYLENLEYPSHELFIGNASGQTEQLTYLTNFFNDTVRIGFYRWSPDNIHVAFQVAHGKTGQLAVVNTATNEITVYELSGYFVHHEPVWSPDGMFILIDGYFEDTNEYLTLLIDLDESRIIKIATNSFPVGWIIFTQ